MRRLPLGVLLAAVAASAFIRSRTSGGTLLRRADFANIRYIINDQTAPGLMNSTGGFTITPDSDPIAALQAALDAWTNVPTSAAAFARPEILPLGITGSDRQHVMTFADTPENRRSASGDTIAVTLPFISTLSGEIVDSDIVFNPALPFSTTVQPGTYDIQAVALHELGHALGAAHSGLVAPTMFSRGRAGTSIQAVLTADDMAFVTEVYPEPGSQGLLGSISGTVTQTDGLPIAGALVTAIAPATGIAIGSITRGNGTYAITQAAPGQYFLYTEPMDGPVEARDIGEAGNGANTAFATAFLGGAAAPTSLLVRGGANTPADLVVEAGTPPLNIQGGGAAPLGTGSLSLFAGPFALNAGQPAVVAVFGRGLDDPTITESAVSFLGAPVTIRPGTFSRGFTTSGIPSLRFTVDVARDAPLGVATVLVRSATAAAVFSAGAKLLPSPSFSAAGVTNAATFATGAAAPGEIVSIFGTNLGPASGVSGAFDGGGRLATSVAGVTLTFNGFRAPLYFVRQDQINAQVPFEVAGQSFANVVISYQGLSSFAVNVPVAAAQPAIFVRLDGTGRPWIFNQDSTLNDIGRGAPRGTVVTIYANGQGTVSPPLATGAPGAAAEPFNRAPGVTAMIGGQSAIVHFAGMTPGFVGLLQVNAEVPAGAPTGPNVPVVVTIGSASSQPNVMMAVQ